MFQCLLVLHQWSLGLWEDHLLAWAIKVVKGVRFLLVSGMGIQLGSWCGTMDLKVMRKLQRNKTICWKAWTTNEGSKNRVNCLHHLHLYEHYFWELPKSLTTIFYQKLIVFSASFIYFSLQSYLQKQFRGFLLTERKLVDYLDGKCMVESPLKWDLSWVLAVI